MRIDRLIGILTILLQQEKTTTLHLSEHFEVSRRTILRDIDALNLAGIPILTIQGKNGGVSIMPGYKINKSVLTIDEFQNLIAALKGLDSLSNQTVSKSLLTKLAPEHAIVAPLESIVIDLSGSHKDSIPDKISLLKEAIAKKLSVSFDYYYAKGETKRTIDPYCIEFRWQAWYVFGWCHTREDFRRFKLNRLWQLTLSEESFVYRPLPSLAQDPDESFSESNTVEILFDKSVRFRLIEEYGLNCYQETTEGLRLTKDYTNKEYILGWVLSFADKAKILGPPQLKEEFRLLTERLHRQYR